MLPDKRSGSSPTASSIETHWEFSFHIDPTSSNVSSNRNTVAFDLVRFNLGGEPERYPEELCNMASSTREICACRASALKL